MIIEAIVGSLHNSVQRVKLFADVTSEVRPPLSLVMSENATATALLVFSLELANREVTR